MKPIVEKMLALKEYYEFNRNVGHTTLLKEGINNSKNEKFLVLAFRKEDHTLLNVNSKDIVSWNYLDQNILCGHNKPLAIDNAAMYALLTEALTYIAELELNKYKLDKIKAII